MYYAGIEGKFLRLLGRAMHVTQLPAQSGRLSLVRIPHPAHRQRRILSTSNRSTSKTEPNGCIRDAAH